MIFFALLFCNCIALGELHKRGPKTKSGPRNHDCYHNKEEFEKEVENLRNGGSYCVTDEEDSETRYGCQSDGFSKGKNGESDTDSGIIITVTPCTESTACTESNVVTNKQDLSSGEIDGFPDI